MTKKIIGMTVLDFCKKYGTAPSSTYKALNKGGEEAVLQLLIYKTVKEIKKDTPELRTYSASEIRAYDTQQRQSLEKIIHEVEQKKELPVLSIITLVLLIVTILIVGL